MICFDTFDLVPLFRINPGLDFDLMWNFEVIHNLRLVSQDSVYSHAIGLLPEDGNTLIIETHLHIYILFV